MAKVWTKKKGRVQKYRYGVRSKQQTTDNGDKETEDMGTRDRHGSEGDGGRAGRDRQTDRQTDRQRHTERGRDGDRQIETERLIDSFIQSFIHSFFHSLVKLYFSTVKILAKRPSHISAVAAVLLITKTETKTETERQIERERTDQMHV